MSVPSQRGTRRGKKEGFSQRERKREEYVSSSAKGAMAEKGRREACKR
jgi:hypothetical protein